MDVKFCPKCKTGAEAISLILKALCALTCSSIMEQSVLFSLL